MGRAARSRSTQRVSRRLAALVLAWAVLLGISHGARALRAPPPLDPADTALDVAEVAGSSRRPERPVRLVYREWPGPSADAPVVLLLHGSPGSKGDFAGLAPLLAGRFRVVAPDLPGFGASARVVPDYSIEAHAGYVAQLLDRLGIDRVHVVGFSMGGGVALELYDAEPRRVASLTLLSAIGVQEFELLGDHDLNHLVHAAQLAGLWLVHEGLPHMGWLDRSMLSVAYARNFFDTDQRPLRGILARLEPPTSILHGGRDFLVPPQAAREHARIVPQSELDLPEHESHFMVFQRPERVADRIASFVERVEAGLVPTRAQATAERVAAAAAPFDPASVPPATGVALLVLLGLIVVATFVSEDVACVGVGLIVAHGRIELLPGIVACAVGIILGDLLLYAAGRFAGRPALAHAPLDWLVDDAQVEAAKHWFDARGAVAIGLSRFMPGSRLPVYFGAGMLHMPFWRFCFWLTLAVSVWTPLVVWISMRLGARALATFHWLQGHWLAAVVLLLAIFVVIRIGVDALTHRGRRLLVGTWRRWTRWEFWPPWVFYPPVVAWVAWLGLRHRSPLLFTAANPAMPASGFVSESKGEILRGLAAVAGERLARFAPLPGAESVDVRVALAEDFRHAHGLDWPVVLKPDAGQRGSGVAIVHSARELREYLERARCDTLIQEFAPGHELGVFHYRLPGEPAGRILSVTEKRLPVVVGDGRRNVERLILDDPRAVCMAATYLGRQAHQLDRVPAEGEAVRLVDLGTHCRGAVFLDGRHLLTPALEREIDRISRGYDGFWFGRYDLRAPDLTELAHGRGFKIVELNGVTSEATHIYDPQTSLWQAYRTLFEQWSIAFEIGRRNRARGVRPVGVRTLVGLIRAYRRTSRGHPEWPVGP